MAEVTKVEIVSDDCISCEQCVSECDAVFEMNDDKAVIKPGVDIKANSDGIIAAAGACPSDAIKYQTA